MFDMWHRIVYLKPLYHVLEEINQCIKSKIKLNISLMNLRSHTHKFQCDLHSDHSTKDLYLPRMINFG